jgi:hypothetical protein
MSTAKRTETGHGHPLVAEIKRTAPVDLDHQ